MFQDFPVDFVITTMFVLILIWVVASLKTDAPPGYVYKVANYSSLDGKSIIPVTTIPISEEGPCEEIIAEVVPESNRETEEGCTGSLNDVYYIDGRPYKIIDIIGYWKLLQSKKQTPIYTEDNSRHVIKYSWARKFLRKAKLKATQLTGIFKCGTKHRND